MQPKIVRFQSALLVGALSMSGVVCKPAMAQTAAPESAPAGTWAFTPPRDEFSPNALLDLRYLNEKVAGQSGFVRRSADGNDFVLGNGQPARFWSMLSFYKNIEDTAKLEHHARWMAKRGINFVRLFGNLNAGENSKATDMNTGERDGTWRSVAAFKKEGMYTSIMPFWSHSINGKHLKSWGIEGDADQSPMGLIFFDKTYQNAYKSWMKQMLDPVNPHTGLRLADDPALAVIELQNEDSLLFWTAQGIKGAQLRKLEKLFGDFLIKKYGSLDKANAAWLAAGPADLGFQEGVDDFAQGRAGIYIVWHWTQQQTGYKALRLADQLQFFGETMRDFNAEMVRYLRENLGCKQLINAGNWKTADPVLLNDVERWSYTVGDVISVNRYYNGIHTGPRAGWSWDVGDTFTNESATLDPRSLPLNMKQVVGHPNVVGESGWIAPSKYQTEGPFLTAAYASLTGVDTLIWQSIGDGDEWQNHADGKWHQGTPQTLGQFPAAALMFRNGYIKKGAPVVHEERTIADLWNRREPLIAEDKSFDPNRDTGSGGSKSNLKSDVNPLAFLVGPVEVKYSGDPKKTSVANLKPFINEATKTVRSNTGEINLDYGNGLCTVDTPRAQGATGFLEKFPSVKLADVTLRSTNEYATLNVVSMDNLPIRQSRKLLVQVGTVVRPTGWQDQDAAFEGSDKKPVRGKQIVAVGKTPFQITNVDATVAVNNSLLKSATLLDINGMAAGTIPVTRKGANFSVNLPANAMYVVLQG